MTDHHPQTSSRGGRPPTLRQQRYLRQLALARGVTFVPPRTGFEASRLIDQLKRRDADSSADRRRELRAVQDALAGARGDAARIRDDEISGYGASATWKRGRS